VFVACVVGTLMLGARWLRLHLLNTLPITYVDASGRVHLTNEQCTLDIELGSETCEALVGNDATPPSWSPSGERLMYTHRNSGGDVRVVVFEPRNDRWWELRRWSRSDVAGFDGWIDDETIYEARPGQLSNPGNDPSTTPFASKVTPI
jgi:hypothetical protein